jgi:hypothetical protein
MNLVKYQGAIPKEGGESVKENEHCPHKERPHYAKGMCRSCYWRFRYWGNPDYREKEKKRMRKTSLKWFKKKIAKNPKWNAKRQREYRKKYPENFNYLMAKFYMKKLTQEKVTELLREIGYGKEDNT